MRNPLLIFDLDGTLVDSEVLSAKVILEMMPVDMTAEEICSNFRGAKLIETLEGIAARTGAAIPKNYQDRFAELSNAVYRAELKSFPGIGEALASMPNQRCVASNARQPKIKLALDITNLTPHFDHLFSAYDINSWKPDPDLFLHAANKMGFSPSECIVVEDSEIGIEAAQKAGMTVFQHVHKNGIPPVNGLKSFTSYSALPGLVSTL